MCCINTFRIFHAGRRSFCKSWMEDFIQRRYTKSYRHSEGLSSNPTQPQTLPRKLVSSSSAINHAVNVDFRPERVTQPLINETEIHFTRDWRTTTYHHHQQHQETWREGKRRHHRCYRPPRLLRERFAHLPEALKNNIICVKNCLIISYSGYKFRCVFAEFIYLFLF